MSSIPTSSTAQTLVIPTGAELYDQIMGAIEPELLSANVPHLDEKYAGESDADRAKRYDRYTKAYAQYDKRYAAWESDMKNKVHAYRKTAFNSVEAESREEEVDSLKQLEADIETAPADSAH